SRAKQPRSRASPAAAGKYGLPSIRSHIGEEKTEAPHWKCHSTLPEAASSAMKFPSASPVNTSPPAVESTPAQVGEVCFHSHLSFPVLGSMARSAPVKGAASSFGKYALP